MNIEWEDGFTIKVKVEENTVVISANKEGLLSLARHLTDLADAEVGNHIHYDEYNSLEEDSSEMIIERIV
jgi:bisphosphoglycerate-dependent phosphoglycerate mutase